MQKILLVSDSPGFLERNKLFLERSGFRLFTAASAVEAIELQREVHAQVIIAMLDQRDKGGEEFCSRIRRDPELKKVSIILVCYNAPEALARAAACGADAWMIKPLQPHLLLETVENLLLGHQPREHRVQLTAPVSGHHGTMRFTGILHNISVSGLLCETDLELAPDDQATLHIELGSDEIVADGKVARRVVMSGGRYNYGIRFTRLAPAARRQIATLVEGTGTMDHHSQPAVAL
jgi:DNA-binding response OmpR family regulator